MNLTLRRWPVRSSFFLLGSLGLAFATPLVYADTLQFDRVHPAAVAVGGEATVTAEGKFPTWPVEIYCDRDDVRVQCEAESGKLTVQPTPEAHPGVAWLRLIDSQGVSELKPLLIEPTPVINEQEPNGSLKEAPVTALPATIVGKLEKNGDVDGLQIELAAGETLVATVIANRLLQSDMDAVLQLVDLSGHVLAQSDDEIGIDPQLVYTATHTAPAIVRLFAFPETPNSTIGFAGGASYAYALRLSKGPVADHFLPLLSSADSTALPFGWNLASRESQMSPATSISPSTAWSPAAVGWQWSPELEGDTLQSIVEDATVASAVARLPALLSGHIAEPGEVDAFRFHATAGGKLRAQVLAREYGFPLDSVLRIVDPSTGKELARNDDAGGNTYDASLDFTPAAEADLDIQISDLADSASPRHAYSIKLYEVQPNIRLAVDKDRIVLKPGGEGELTISLTRADGFDRKLSITATDLPPGVTCPAVISEATGETSKSIHLKFSAEASTAALHAHFRVMATEMEPGEGQTARQWPARFPLRPQVAIDQLWLTIAAP